jgi:hypothetical protein
VFAWRAFLRRPGPGAGGPGAFLTVPSLAGAGIRAIFTTRLGGFSEPPFASLNLSFASGDDRDRVRRNRSRALETIGLPGEAWTGGRQVHGTRVARVGASERGAGAEEAGTTIRDTDGLWTDEAGCALVVLAADCVPLLLADPERRRVAVVHVGRRGLLSGIVAGAVDAIGPSRALLAFVGPSIGPCCYEVDEPSADSARAEYGDDVVRGPGRRHLDLWRGCTVALARSGVRAVWTAALCTRCEPHRFFSHRAQDRGRQGVIAALA